MEPARLPALPPAVDDLRSRLRRWRSARVNHGPIPEDLWAEAARLARSHGVSPIATALGLGYYGLKKRVEAAKEISAGANRPAFVEIEARPSVFPPNCAVEVEKRDGSKMTIRLSGSATVNVAALVDSFLGRRR